MRVLHARRLRAKVRVRFDQGRIDHHLAYHLLEHFFCYKSGAKDGRYISRHVYYGRLYTDPDCAAEVTSAVRQAVKKPLIVKLTPNVTDIAAVAKAVEAAGADTVCLINTVLSLRIDLKTRRPVLANVTGGLSGPAVFPLALRMVYQVSQAVSVPVIGVGGISSAEDVLEMMLAGATAVEVGAANLVRPTACRDIIEALPAAMERYGIRSLKEIIGGAHG
jgi:dihydroorotate dehydrogenase (NAD+) catalytic subunit